MSLGSTFLLLFGLLTFVCFKTKCPPSGVSSMLVQQYLLQWLFAEGTSQVVVQASLNAVLAERVSTGRCHRFVEQSLGTEHKNVETALRCYASLQITSSTTL